VLAVLFFVPAMNLGGIPPFSGFLGKVGLLEAGVELGTPLGYALVTGSVVTSLLTLYALIKAWNKAFWQSPPEELPANHVPAHMVVPTAALVVVSLALTVFAGPLYAYTERAAQTLADRFPYIEAVLPDGERGEGESQRAAEDSEVDEDLVPATQDAENGGGDR